MNIKELIQRNTPVLVIGGITVLVFLFIIVSAQNRSDSDTKLIEAPEGDLITPHTYVKGPIDAKVTLVEFTDYGCPACKSFQPHVNAVVKKYEDKIKFGVRHFPLPQHKDSDRAAAAAQAAGEQGKFWDFAEVLYEYQGVFDDTALANYADIAGLDVQKFKDDLGNPAFKDIVEQDIRYGRQIGVNSTPTFLLNGKQLKIDKFEDLESAVVGALKDAGVSLTGPSPEEVMQQQKIEEKVSEDIYKKIDERFGTLEIEYSEDKGFTPNDAIGNSGQLVRWKNNSIQDITIVQLMQKFDELDRPFVVKAGQTFESRLRLREFGMWTYNLEGSEDGRASIDINKMPEDVAAMLPENIKK